MIRKMMGLVLAAAIIVTSIAQIRFAAETDTTFASLHGALNTNEDDAYYFATAMQSNGWTPTITCRYSRYCRVGTCDHLQNANATIVYWSGHGLDDGTFSYYTTPLAYHNYDRTHAQIVDGYVNYTESTRKYYDYVKPLQTNSKTDWVVLASCNQMTTSTSRGKYKDILTTKSARPMKGILGYGAGALAPDGTDNSIAQEFVRLCFDTSGRRRTTYAWLQANTKYGYYNPTALIRADRIDDTLTSSAVPSNIGSTTTPTIKYLYYDANKVLQTETASLSVDLTTNSLTADNVNDNDSVVSEITLTNDQIEGNITDEKGKNKLYSSGSNVIEDAQLVVNDTNIISSDFKPFMELTLNSEEDGNKEVMESTVLFARYINGIRVSVLPGKGEQVFVTMSPDGYTEMSYSIQKRFTLDQTKKSGTMVQKKDIIPQEKAIEKALEKASKITERYLGDVAIENTDLVYVIAPQKDKLVLAWETLDNYGNYTYVNAVNGQEIVWPEPVQVD